MSDREKLPELIDRFNDGKLSGEELTAFLEMLKTNPRLKEEVRLDSELNEILANEDIIELRRKILKIQGSRQKRNRPDLYFFLLAASFLLLLGIEALLFMNTINHSPAKNTILNSKHKPAVKQGPENARVEHPVIQMDTAIKGKRTIDRKPETMLSANFRKNLSFENMIGTTRHTGNFRMEAPVTGYQFGEKEVIGFEWALEGDDEIDLKIMDNTGTIVHESGALGKNKYSLPQGTLKRGLYYFKVMEKDEILYFGKFIIK